MFTTAAALKARGSTQAEGQELIGNPHLHSG
jgi:hypothetical protein